MTEFLTLGLSKKVIFDKIGLFTSYLAGKRSEDYAEYDRIAVDDSDIPLLDYASDDAASLLAGELGGVVARFEIEGDVIRYVLKNPYYGVVENPEGVEATGRASGAATDEKPSGMPDCGLMLRLMESYIVAETIIRWLRIAGYEFGEGTKQALTSAGEVAAAKMKLLRGALTPPANEPVSEGPKVVKARRRRLPPL